MTETFGERLRRIRLARGFTVAGLARAVDVSEGSIRQLEDGITQRPSLHTGLRIAFVLDVSPYVLAFGTSEPPQVKPSWWGPRPHDSELPGDE
jgi:transcriptional regulator with XRE-family HTH domain